MKTKDIMKRFGAVLLAFVLALGMLTGASPAVTVQAGGPPEFVEVLVGGPGAAAAVQNANGRITHQFTNFVVVLAEVPEPAVEGLRQARGVDFVEPNGEMWAIDQTTPWGISRVKAPDAWDSGTGGGIRLAILDTGIDGLHEDLTNVATDDGINTIDDTDHLSDGHGHGTHVAGTAGAVNNTLGVVGVAPGVTLVAVKVLDDSGSGTYASVAAGIDWSISNNIQVINMSLGGGDSSTVRTAVESAWNKGLLLVAAAGNSGNPRGIGNNVSYPAAYDQVIAVAASDQNDNRAWWSSTGPQVELIAPGVSILSTVPGNKYDTKSGTSMASPHVAGAAALAWSVNSALSNAEVRQVLRDTAEDLGMSQRHQGYGLVRADRAVAAVASPEPAVKVALSTDKAEYISVTDTTAVLTAVVTDETGAAISGLESSAFATTVDGVTASVNFAETATAGTYQGDLDISGLAEGTHTVAVTVTDTRELSGSGTASFSIVTEASEPAAALWVKVETDKTTYNLGEWVYITVTVSENDESGSAVAGAAVNVNITTASGRVYAGDGTTNGDGTVQFRLKTKNPDGTGTYSATATASKSGYESGEATTTFEVE